MECELPLFAPTLLIFYYSYILVTTYVVMFNIGLGFSYVFTEVARRRIILLV